MLLNYCSTKSGVYATCRLHCSRFCSSCQRKKRQSCESRCHLNSKICTMNCWLSLQMTLRTRHQAESWKVHRWWWHYARQPITTCSTDGSLTTLSSNTWQNCSLRLVVLFVSSSSSGGVDECWLVTAVFVEDHFFSNVHSFYTKNFSNIYAVEKLDIVNQLQLEKVEVC